MLETVIGTLGVSGTVGLGSLLAQNIIPQDWQFWAKDDNNIGELARKLVVKIARDVAADGELDGDRK